MKYSLKFRIWHWLNAIVVLGLVGTVLLRWTLFSKSANAEILINKLTEMGITISHDQSVILARALRVELWEWHIILGFAFTGLVLYRIYLHYVDSKKRYKFSELDMHHKAVRASYCALYTTFVIMAGTGLLIYFSKDLGISKELAHYFKEIHEFVYYYIAFFIPVHIAGVFFADATNEKGLVSDMINGGKS